MQERIFEMLNSKEFNDLDTYYVKETFMDILDVSRKEFAHSNFLAWLFNSKSNHTLGDYAIRKLLEMLYDKLSKDIQEAVAMGNYEVNNLNVSREIRTDCLGIIDIFINFDIVTSNIDKKLYIIVENKIESEEHDDQTLKYQRWWEKSNLKNEEVLMLYFTPHPEQEVSSKRFIKVSYTDLCNKILDYCEKRETNEIAKNLMSDYICCLNKPSLTSGTDVNYSVLAVNDDIKDKVNKLLDKYSPIIKDIIKALTYRNNKFINSIFKTRIMTFKGIFYTMLYIIEDKELIDSLNTIIFNKVSKVEFNGKQYKPYGRRNSIGYLVHDIIEKYVQDNEIAFKELKALLVSKEWLSPWVDELITKDIPKDPEHFFMKEEDKLKLKDCKIYVARYWTYADALTMAELLKQDIH